MITPYELTEQLIEQQGWWFSPAESQGVCSALWALNKQESALNFLFGENQAVINLTVAKRFLDALFAQIEEHQTEKRFTILLPEDQNLSARAEELVAWARGFLMVLNHHQLAQKGDLKEPLKLLAQMAELDTNIDSNEENEGHFAFLENHAEFCVALLAEHHRPNNASKSE